MHAKCSTGSARPPAAEDFAAYPASWYLFCASGQLKDKPFSQRILGRQLVAYRKASGQVAVMDANCAHLSIRRLFTFGYLADEARRLRGTRYNPASLGPNDKDMIEYFQWAASLPQTAPTPINPKAKEDFDEETNLNFDVPVSRGSASVIASPAGKG